MNILVTDGMDASAVQSLRDAGFAVTEQFYAPEELGKALRDFDAVVVRSATKVRKIHIDEALETGRLKLIVRGGVGTDNIDVAYAEEKGIAVRNTPNASSNSVAELALGHMFSTPASPWRETMRAGKWEKKAYSRALRLGAKPWASSATAASANAWAIWPRRWACRFWLTMCAGSRSGNRTPCIMQRLDEIFCPLRLHEPAHPAIGDKPLIDAEAIGKMKDEPILINTSRGNQRRRGSPASGPEQRQAPGRRPGRLG